LSFIPEGNYGFVEKLAIDQTAFPPLYLQRLATKLSMDIVPGTLLDLVDPGLAADYLCPILIRKLDEHITQLTDQGILERNVRSNLHNTQIQLSRVMVEAFGAFAGVVSVLKRGKTDISLRDIHSDFVIAMNHVPDRVFGIAEEQEDSVEEKRASLYGIYPHSGLLQRQPDLFGHIFDHWERFVTAYSWAISYRTYLHYRAKVLNPIGYNDLHSLYDTDTDSFMKSSASSSDSDD